MLYQKIIFSLFFTLISFTACFSQQSGSLQFVSHIDMAAYAGYDGNYNIVCNDVEGYVSQTGTEYAVVGTHKGIAIVDVSNASSPQQVAYVAGGIGTTWREIAIYSHYAYCVTDGREALGVLIIDLANLPTAVTSQYWIPQIPNSGGTPFNLTKSHTIVIEDGIMYLNGFNALNQETAFFDLRTSPTAPTFEGMVNDEYCHDSFIRRDTLYTANIFTGRVIMYDLSDRQNPRQIGTPFNTPFNFTHQVWQSNDSDYLFTTDERPNAPVAAYNVNDLNNVQEVDQFLRYETIGQGSVSHNLYVVPNDYLVIANYTDGVTIVDVKHPDNMLEIANYDTYPGGTPNPPYSGVWATYPYLPSGKMLVSDMASGFYVLQPTYQRASWLEGIVSDGICGGVLNDVKMTIFDGAIAVAGKNTNVTGVFKTGYKQAGNYTLRVEKAGYVTQNIPIVLQQGIVVTQNISLIPLGTTNLTTRVEDLSNAPLNQAKLKLSSPTINYQATTNTSGQAGFNCVIADSYDFFVGKWGYETKKISGLPISATTMSLPSTNLTTGYQDPFDLDLGWTTATANANNTGWQLEKLIRFNNAPVTQNITCYVTHSGGTTVDNGSATLLSPPMNLASLPNAILHFNVRVAAPSGLAFAKFYLVTPTQTILIDSSGSTPSNVWVPKNINIASFALLNNFSVQFMVRVESPQAGTPIEVGIDNFYVTTSTVTETEVATKTRIHTQPNPFFGTCKVQLSTIQQLDYQSITCIVYNQLGQLVARKDLSLTGDLTLGDELSSGAYFVCFMRENEVLARTKIIKLSE